MKVLVSGANGLIGRHLVAALRARGDEVIGLVRTVTGRESWTAGATLRAWDGRTAGAWSADLEGADAVVNLAGGSVARRWNEAIKKDIFDSRVQATQAVVSALRAASRRPRVLVNASAIGFYGNGLAASQAPVDESAPPGNDFLATVCQRWEDEARSAETLGVRTVLLRTGIVLAREGGALTPMLAPFRAFVGGPLGSGQQWFPWIHMADEVGLILHALDHDTVRGPVNAVAPGVESLKDFCKTMGRVLHRPSWAALPAPALRMILGEFADVLLGGHRVVPAAALAAGYRFRFLESEAALTDLLGHSTAPKNPSKSTSEEVRRSA